MNLTEWNARLHGLVIFRALLDDDVIAKLVDLTDRMAAAPQSPGAVCDAAASFEAALFEHTTNFGEYLSAAVLEAETVCVRQAAVSEVPPVLQTALDNELDFLRQLCSLTLDELLDAAGAADKLPFLPRWETKAIDLHAAYAQRMSEVGKKGYGMFAKHHVFTVENGQLVPVRYPDPQRLDELPGYEQEREKVIANTRALLEGKPANNVLLYGDRGTGKSSTIHAILNAYKEQGLRMIEIPKSAVEELSLIREYLADSPMKFIIYIDDLSFDSQDNAFTELKAALEGGLSACQPNTLIYATSNRRHLIKENFSDREDDVNKNDTRQEQLSLSDRFGLTITFINPDKKDYLDIVEKIAADRGLQVDAQRLDAAAEQWAVRRGGRSPRCARQFIDHVESALRRGKEW